MKTVTFPVLSWLSGLSLPVILGAVVAGAVAQLSVRVSVPEDYWDRLQDGKDVAAPTTLGAAMVAYWLSAAAVYGAFPTRLTYGLFLTGLGIGMAAFVPLGEAAYRDRYNSY